MSRSRVLLLMVAMAVAWSLQAARIPEKEAAMVAKKFFYERIAQYRDLGYDEISTLEILTVRHEGMDVYYAVNMAPEGFILVSARDEAYPFLAYSFDGRYDETGQPENFTAWVGQYARQIFHAATENPAADDFTARTWAHYRSVNPEDLSPLRGREVEPLLTSTWDQGKYYNQMCPGDPAGPGGHCYAGCVATAMGQVMNYFRWPGTGTGSYTYSCPPYGTLSAHFDSTEYRWDLMETSLVHSNLYLAELLYHLGVSVDMVYGPDGSGMYNHKAAYSLRTYFKYSPETQYVYRDSTTMDWDSLLVSHLDQRIPMYYAGWSVPDINGHAFVCDGYQDSAFYHFNWGWGGSYDGYFYTDNLTPGGSLFNLAQELIIHAVPDTANYVYPAFCEGETEFGTLYGTIEDGSGPLYPYPGLNACQWLVAPADSIDGITLEFLRFDLGAGDTLRVYDGDTITAPLLALLTSSSQPGPIDTDGSRMLVMFNSDAPDPGEGFLAEFSSDIPVYCSGNTVLSAQADTMADGSGPWWYQNNSQCIWMITPEGASEVTLNFLDFETEEGYDFLRIYDMETQELLAEYSGSFAPGVPDPVTSTSGKMFMVFITNYTGRSSGWTAHYSTNLVGISDRMGENPGFRVYPNPSSGQFTLDLSDNPAGYNLLRIQDMYGRILLHEEMEDGTGTRLIQLGHLPGGIYNLVLSKDEAHRAAQRIIIQ